LLTGFEDGAHCPDIAIDGLHGHGCDVRWQLAFEEALADICILVP